jgi:hypothetical protein
MGTNPNSSSIGTLLYALPVSLAAVGTIAGIVCAARQDKESRPARGSKTVIRPKTEKDDTDKPL